MVVYSESSVPVESSVVVAVAASVTLNAPASAVRSKFSILRYCEAVVCLFNVGIWLNYSAAASFVSSNHVE